MKREKLKFSKQKKKKVIDITADEKKEMREWTSSNSAVVRQ